MVRLDSDLLPYLVGAAAGQLPAEPLRWDARPALCVVMASEGYPGSYAKGHAIRGLDAAAKLSVKRHTGHLIDELSTFDGVVRLFGGRRNVYIWILSAAWMLGNISPGPTQSTLRHAPPTQHFLSVDRLDPCGRMPAG